MRNFLVICLLSVAASGCDKGDEFAKVEPVQAPEATAPAEPVAPDPGDSLPSGHPPVNANAAAAAGTAPAVGFSSPDEFGKVGPLRWSAPDSWQAAKPASSMRLAEYVVTGESGEPAVLTVFYFGPAGGGGVDANITRWTGQFGADGASAKRGETVVNGMKVHTVDVAGTYNAGMAGGNQPAKQDQRMLGAIVESSAGLFFFKLVGPNSLITANEDEWNAFVQSFAPAA